MPLTGLLGTLTASPEEQFPTNWLAPTIDEVAALMFARVTGEYGALQTFTAETRPTAGQVTTKIRQAMSMVAPRVGFDLDARFHESARFLVVLYTATITEPSYWPEQLAGDMSAWDEWRALYIEGLAALLAAIAETGAGGEPGPGDDALNMVAVWNFGTDECHVPGAELPYEPCSRRRRW